MKKKETSSIFLTVIIPFYNEQEVLENFHSRLIPVLSSIQKPIEILYVMMGAKIALTKLLCN